MGLYGKADAELSGIKVEENNPWLTLIQSPNKQQAP
jgi:hypothetical protein